MIVIGIGTGRSGTASLAKLLNAQQEAACFHEMNPSCVRFAGTPRPILNTVDEFQAIVNGGEPRMLTVDLGRAVAARAYDQLCAMPRVRLIGDIAFYYLTYVEQILAEYPQVRFICLKRDRTETVESWMHKSTIERWRSRRWADRLAAWLTRQHYFDAHNYWMEHDGTQWLPDPVWDKCFPKFPGPTRREAIEQYWDYYYAEIERIRARTGDAIYMVPTERLNERATQEAVLAHCGLTPAEMVFTDAHIHRSRRVLEAA